MGMYTGLRFKGIVKEPFRKDFEQIALHGDWDKSEDEMFLLYSKFPRAKWIPMGPLNYMPDSWENCDGSPEIPTEYNSTTGYWSFQCSLKNYDNTIGLFLALVPHFIERVEYCEVFYEDWTHSMKYDLIENQMVVVDDCFIKYDDYDYYGYF